MQEAIDHCWPAFFSWPALDVFPVEYIPMAENATIIQQVLNHWLYKLHKKEGENSLVTSHVEEKKQVTFFWPKLAAAAAATVAAIAPFLIALIRVFNQRDIIKDMARHSSSQLRGHGATNGKMQK